MTPNDIAASYGLFNVLFAELDQFVSIALLGLRKHADPDASFDKIHGHGFKKNCDALRQELKQFEGKTSVEFDLQRTREALRRAGIVNEWRRARVHCFVHRTSEGFALYDWKSRQRLSLSVEECQERIQELTYCIVDLQSCGAQLSNHLD